jgi:four helix bundle protein
LTIDATFSLVESAVTGEKTQHWNILMTPQQMKDRTKAYALRVVKVVQSPPQNRICDILGGQLLRAGTSVGANYRAACRAKSPPDFVNKLKIVEEECDESLFWMEILVEAGLVKLARLSKLMGEGNALLALTVSSAKTARSSNSRVNRQSSIVNRR